MATTWPQYVFGVDGDEPLERRTVQHSVEMTLGHLRVLDTPPAPDHEIFGRTTHQIPDEPPRETPLTLEDLYRQHRMRLVGLAAPLAHGGRTPRGGVQGGLPG